MHMDPIMPAAVATLLGLFVVGLLLRMLSQPHVVGYLIAGVVLGPFGLALVTDGELIGRLGALGVVLLLFFVGMEIAPKRLIEGWRIALLGTALQVILSVGVAALIGSWLDWSVGRIVLIGFVISLSSTAVVIKLLQESGEIDTPEGRDIIGILLAQDLIIIPMLIVIALMGGGHVDGGEIIRQVSGALLFLLLFAWIVKRDVVHLPLARWLRHDHEVQIFAALGLCFGFALLSGFLGLSTALGAFAAGMLVAAARETQWVHHALDPFRVLFLAFFFLSVGMLLDLNYLITHLLQVTVTVVAVLVINTLINGVLLRLLGYSWRQGFYAGAVLAQIGEFSFVLAAVGHQTGLITTNGYQLVLAVIALTLLVSPLWIRGAKTLLRN